MSSNPYAAPTTHVADVPEQTTEGNFIAAGRARPAGNGWDWIKSARALTLRRGWLWIGAFIVFVLIGIAISVIPIVGTVAMYFVAPVLLGGVMLTCDKSRRGEPISFGDFFAGFRTRFGALAGIGLATLLMYVAIFAVVGVFFGFSSALLLSGAGNAGGSPGMAFGILLAALVVMALSIPVYMALWFSYALVSLNGLPVIVSLKTSFSACLNNIAPFLVYGAIALVLAIIATIPAGLGWLILGPVMMATLYTGYRDIFYES